MQSCGKYDALFLCCFLTKKKKTLLILIFFLFALTVDFAGIRSCIPAPRHVHCIYKGLFLYMLRFTAVVRMVMLNFSSFSPLSCMHLYGLILLWILLVVKYLVSISKEKRGFSYMLIDGRNYY